MPDTYQIGDLVKDDWGGLGVIVDINTRKLKNYYKIVSTCGIVNWLDKDFEDYMTLVSKKNKKILDK